MTTADRPRSQQRGQILPLFALMLTLLLLPVTALAVDGGLLLARHADLVATAQAAAEAGSQAVDVTALDRSGRFQLCAAPDGGPSCGNGIGEVDAVVQSLVAVGLPGASPVCLATATAVGPPTPGQPTGCRVALVSLCPSPGADPGPPEGVTVLLWQTVHLPLLSLGRWGVVVTTASATSWLAHGQQGGPEPGQTEC